MEHEGGGLFDLLLRGGRAISEARGQAGSAIRGLLEDPRGTIAQGFRDLRQDPALDFVPLVGDVKSAAVDAPQAFSEGRPGLGLLALIGGIPGVPGVPRGLLFQGLSELKERGLRVFARTDVGNFAVPSRRAVVITPNTVPGEGPFRASILEETRGGVRARGHVHGPSEKELVEVIEGKVTVGGLAERADRAGIVGFPEIPVGREARMEFIAERNARRELTERARQQIVEGRNPTGLMQKTAEGRELPGGVGGFFFR